MKKIAIIALVAAAFGFFAASQAHAAYSEFTKHLAKHACSGHNSYFLNGCYAYIEPRLKAKSTSESLKWCKEKRCDSWFGYNSGKKQKCYDGCTYLYNFGQ